MKRKSGLSKFNIFLSVVLVICLVATIVMVAKPAKVDETSANAANEDVSVLETSFAAGTYGGKEFSSIEDVVNYYNECYNYTKTLTAQYNENGNTETYYKLLGEETLDVGSILIEGSSNSMIDNLVPGIVGGLFTGGVNGLSPSGGKVSGSDTRDDGKFDCNTSSLTADDVLDANVVDNGDGTIDITIQPKSALLSMAGQDSQGRFFNSLGDISSVVESITVLSFSQGTVNDNFVVDYKGGTGTVTIDTATGEVTKGLYVMKVHVDVQHANVTVLKDKSAALDITYTCTFPASDEYLQERGITRA